MTEPPPSRPPVLFLRPLPILFGAVAGFGLAVLLQQFAVTPLTTLFLFAMVFMGILVIGIALPTALAHGRPTPETEDSRRGAPRATAFSLVALLTLVALFVAVMGAQAQQDEDCTATINGERTHDRVELSQNGEVDWALSSRSGNISSWEVVLHYGWLSFPLDVGTDSPPVETTKEGTKDLDDYPNYGVGVYRLTGTVNDENGGTCTGMIDAVVPGNPLVTPMGLAAAALTTIGVVGGSASANAATRPFERAPQAETYAYERSSARGEDDPVDYDDPMDHDDDTQPPRE